jgi:hypothetical protein
MFARADKWGILQPLGQCVATRVREMRALSPTGKRVAAGNAGSAGRRRRGSDKVTATREILLFRGLVPRAFRRGFFAELRGAAWTYGRVAYSPTEELKAWGLTIFGRHGQVQSSQLPAAVALFRLVEDKLLAKGLLKVGFRLVRIGADGRTDGQFGYVHTDGDLPSMLSILYYVNEDWPAAWGGPTQFFPRDAPLGVLADDPKRAELLVQYTPGAFACFPSSQPHASTPPSNGCRELRMTVSFVLENPPFAAHQSASRRS